MLHLGANSQLTDMSVVTNSNVGVMSEPVDKSNYKQTITQLFAHNAMQDEIKRVDPRKQAEATGALGRMASVLQESGYQTGKCAVESAPGNLASTSKYASPIVTLDQHGVRKFLGPEGANDVINTLNQGGTTGLYGEVWSSLLSDALIQTEELFELFQASNISDADFADNQLSKRFKVVAQMIEARKARGVHRDFFFVSFSGWDHHNEVLESLDLKFLDLNEALEDLVNQLQILGVWDDVVIVQTSDFGRTLTPNGGGGSDHGWAGTYFVAGGGVRGNRILGKYPSDLTERGPYNLGRGRMVPTISWDSIFNGIANWMGVTDNDKLDSVLPNRNRFNNLFTAGDLFG
jgi:hypothetical protein